MSLLSSRIKHYIFTLIHAVSQQMHIFISFNLTVENLYAPVCEVFSFKQ